MVATTSGCVFMSNKGAFRRICLDAVSKIHGGCGTRYKSFVHVDIQPYPLTGGGKCLSFG